MGFPFKSVEYKIYSKTFLRKVLVGVTYTVDASVLKDDKTQERLDVFLKQKFELNPSPADLDTHSVSIYNEELGVRYFFTKEYSALILDAKDYRSFFESVSPHISNVILFVREVLGLRDLKTCFIRKLNVFSLENTEDNKNGDLRTQDVVFSKNFLEKPSDEIDNISSEYGIEKELVWTNQELSVKARYKHEQTDSQRIQHFLDIEVVNSPALMLSIEGLEDQDIWKQMNQISFDAFHWCVSQKILEVME